MTDEPANAEVRAIDRLAARLDRPLTELTTDELMVLKRKFDERGVRLYNWISPEMCALIAAAGVYSKAFLEALARRHADALADLVRTRIRRYGREAEVGLDGDAAAKIAITTDTPDEARLALLDLDVTADEVRGKLLRWDSGSSSWRPDPDE